jgi:hypothetical protein
MSDSLADILGSRSGKYDEPPEALAIKAYVEKNYHKPVSVIVRERDIAITVSSGALAATLRMKVPQLQLAANTTKKLLFRIGGIS